MGHHYHGTVIQVGCPVTLLKDLKDNQEKIMAKQSEAAAQLNAVADQLTKIGTEVDALKTALEAAVAADEVSPELAEAINRVITVTQTVDDKNQDA